MSFLPANIPLPEPVVRGMLGLQNLMERLFV